MLLGHLYQASEDSGGARRRPDGKRVLRVQLASKTARLPFSSAYRAQMRLELEPFVFEQSAKESRGDALVILVLQARPPGRSGRPRQLSLGSTSPVARLRNSISFLT